MRSKSVRRALFLPMTFAVFLTATATSLSSSPPAAATEEPALRLLNSQYVEAFLKADVDWYQKHLSDDFVCITSSGAVLNKQEFLRGTAQGPDVADYKLEQVNIRIYGNAALVQATGAFTRKDGSLGKSRYTDVYIRNGDQWKAVSAQITRLTEQ